ncbi:MAG: gamma-glutamyltransferase [Acidobacteriia bacterium]|nr:gamma-glutamyltransferase [Terriglobia bacterium]
MPLHRRSLLVLAFTALAVVCSQAAAMRPAHAQHAMVASQHELASQAGVEIMKQGGNAVDAAVATGFALAVVHPQAGNIGGGGFMLIRLSNGKFHFIDYREKAPAAATRNMYLDAQGNVIPHASLVGYQAIGVPGSVAGMAYAQRNFGKLTLAQVMAPSIRLAHDGFALSYEDAQDLRNPHYHLGEFAESRRIFQRDGKYYEQGEILKQPELARTLERIAKNPDDFYHGALAHELAAAIQKGGGLITAKDLADYEVKEREPVHGSYRGMEIYSAPPPSSGGVALLEILNILEGYDLTKYGAGSAEAVHLTIEAFRRAFYDRAEFMGDPDFAKIPVAQLIDKKYGAAWRESVNPDKASASNGLKRPEIFNELERYASLHALALAPEPSNTTHYSVVDADGNAVAVTTTLNDSFGSAVTAEGLGFLLNDEMDDFTSKAGAPNLFGLLQGEANAIGPGKRPLSAMTPTIIVNNGKLLLVMGSPGGPRIITTVVNVLLGIIDYGLNVQQAVNAPRFHQQWQPDWVYVERVGFSPDTLHLLRNMGHKIATEDKIYPSGMWGDAEVIEINPKTGERLGASDARNNGKALGY